MNGKIKNSFKTKSFRVGGYSIAVIAIVIVLVVIVNIFVQNIPTSFTKFDLTSSELYSISEETEEIVKEITENITVYFIATTGSEDNTINELLGRYKALNSKITVKYIDPATNPNFTSKYTTDTVSSSSLIFESEYRSKVVDYYDIYVTSYSDEELYYYYYYGTMPTGTTSFAGEGCITSALQYVASPEIPTLYTLTGHGESSFDSTMLSYLDEDNIVTAELSLLTSEAVPEDATAVAIVAPTSDINEDEAEKLLEYVNNGGSLILLTNYKMTGFENLYSVTAAYGAVAQEGLMLEGNQNYYMSGYPYFCLPKMQSTDISELVGSSNIYIGMPYAHGISKSSDIASNISYTSLLKSSGAAYFKTDIENIETLEKLDGDVSGQFDLAVLLENTESGGRIVWFASDGIANSTYDRYVSGGNSTYFLSTLTYICDKPQSVSIAAKSMQVQALTVSDFATSVWSTVVTIIIPVAILLGGLIYWLRRRKA